MQQRRQDRCRRHDVVPARHQIIPWDYPKPIVAALNGADRRRWLRDHDVLRPRGRGRARDVRVGRGEARSDARWRRHAARHPHPPGDRARDHPHRRDVRRAPRARARAWSTGWCRPAPRSTKPSRSAERIAANGPLAVRTVKKLVRRSTTAGRRRRAGRARARSARCSASKDARRRAPRASRRSGPPTSWAQVVEHRETTPWRGTSRPSPSSRRSWSGSGSSCARRSSRST